jgi:hypothetical protein
MIYGAGATQGKRGAGFSAFIPLLALLLLL